MLRRVLLTLLTLLIVACMVGSVIAVAGTFLLLRGKYQYRSKQYAGHLVHITSSFELENIKFWERVG